MIFSGELKHTGKVICLLVWFHLCDSLRKYTSISPKDIPIVMILVAQVVITIVHLFNILLFITQFEIVKAFGNKFDHEILSITHVDNKAFFVFKFRVAIVVFYTNGFSKSLHFGLHSLLPCPLFSTLFISEFLRPFFFGLHRISCLFSNNLILFASVFDNWFILIIIRIVTPV